MTELVINIRLINYLVIDWGTTNFRAFALSEDNTLLATKELNQGLLNVASGDFASVLAGILKEWVGQYQHLPIYMAGMVGSAKGWHNVDYVATPALSQGLVKSAYRFTLPWGALATIFPGVSHQEKADHYDVMRGEEVQLFGLINLIAEQNITAVLPGTHSKHAVIEHSKITEFKSFLTGEFYSLILNHSMLGKGLNTDIAFDKSAFIKGVNSADESSLTNKIFLAWTHRLFNNLSEQQTPDFISGLLIGYELKQLKSNKIYLIGNENLCQRYQLASQALSINTEIKLGNDCFLAGMSVLRQGIESEQ